MPTISRLDIWILPLESGKASGLPSGGRELDAWVTMLPPQKHRQKVGWKAAWLGLNLGPQILDADFLSDKPTALPNIQIIIFLPIL